MKRFLVFVFFVLSFHLMASEDIFVFSDQSKKENYMTLTKELRCLVCQNENLQDSNAPFAIKLKTQIYHRVLSGESVSSIEKDLALHYGDFILMSPPFNIKTAMLWFFPFLSLIFGTFFLIYHLSRRSQ